jgi:hypothetical protein
MSSSHRKNPLRPSKILTVVRKLLLKPGAFKPDRSYLTKVNYRNRYGQGAWDKQYPKHGWVFPLFWELTSLSMCRMMAEEREVYEVFRWRKVHKLKLLGSL